MLTECLLRSAPTAQQGVSWQRRLCGLKRCKRVNIYRLFCAFDGGGGGDTLLSFWFLRLCLMLSLFLSFFI